MSFVQDELERKRVQCQRLEAELVNAEREAEKAKVRLVQAEEQREQLWAERDTPERMKQPLKFSRELEWVDNLIIDLQGKIRYPEDIRRQLANLDKHDPALLKLIRAWNGASGDHRRKILRWCGVTMFPVSEIEQALPEELV